MPAVPIVTGFPFHLAIVSACYAIGCAVSAYYIVKWRTGSDLRSSGSGNAGATNAGRSLGKGWFVAIALVDIARGWLAVMLAKWTGLPPAWITSAGLAAVLGHIWPVQLGFRGGKGIATGYGVLLAAHPAAAGLMWLVLLLGKLGWRSTTLGGLTAFAAMPALAAALDGRAWQIILGILVALFVIFAHRQNIRDARAGRQTARQPPSDSPNEPRAA